MFFSFNNFFNSIFVNSSAHFEYIFGNISFIVLFIAVILYWFDFDDTKQGSRKIKSLCMISANFSLTLLLVFRWWESGHFPLSNLYESLIGLSWSFTAVHLIMIITFKGWNPAYPIGGAGQEEHGAKKFFTSGLPLNGEKVDKIGAITAPTALLTSVFATFFLPPEMLRATTLIPALKSNWLTMHVTVMLVSYAFLLIGSLLSMALCAYKFASKLDFNRGFGFNQKKIDINSWLNKKVNTDIDSLTLAQQNLKIRPISNFKQGALEQTNLNFSENYRPTYFNVLEKDFRQVEQNPLSFQSQEDNAQWDICIWLNTMSYRILGLGFPLLTIGILSGAVWANEAWGSYWSWDPKETWALITWLVFAVYFHSRYKRSSDVSIIPATIASIGFIVIWICYLGVNLLQTGLHSYGWFAA